MEEYIKTVVKEFEEQKFIKEEHKEIFEILVAGLIVKGEDTMKNHKAKRIENFLENKKFEQNFDCTASLDGIIKGLEIALAILKDDK